MTFISRTNVETILSFLSFGSKIERKKKQVTLVCNAERQLSTSLCTIIYMFIEFDNTPLQINNKFLKLIHQYCISRYFSRYIRVKFSVSAFEMIYRYTIWMRGNLGDYMYISICFYKLNNRNILVIFNFIELKTLLIMPKSNPCIFYMFLYSAFLS